MHLNLWAYVWLDAGRTPGSLEFASDQASDGPFKVPNIP